MPSAKDRYTATLHELRAKEIMDRRPGVVALRITDAAGQRDAIVQGPRITAGAHAHNGVVLRGEAVSSVHFELELADGGAVLRDLGSKNGTWIGGHSRVREAWLEPGATFTVGGSSIALVGIDPVEIPVSTQGRFGELHGGGTKMGELFAKLERLAAIALDVLVVGETGTGKELVAKGLHALSDRRRGPFIVLDCTNLNEGIAESILFGHKKGAFTGALEDQPGLLEQADGGTLFIDEIGELPAPLQPKLLRALEEHETRRVGESHYRKFDARMVAATNRDLLRMVGDGRFRDDLYFRLAQMKLEIPPLRERGKGDITLLADVFLDRFAGERGASLRFDPETYAALTAYAWPGNVRELRNVIRYGAMWAQGDCVMPTDLPPLSHATSESTPPASTRTSELEEALLLPIADAKLAFERVYVARILAETGGNQSEAARRIGMSRSAFRELLKRVE
jgi:DNA-binding NtrC family response regulator